MKHTIYARKPLKYLVSNTKFKVVTAIGFYLLPYSIALRSLLLPPLIVNTHIDYRQRLKHLKIKNLIHVVQRKVQYIYILVYLFDSDQ